MSRLAGGLIGTKLDKAKFVGSVISHKSSHDAKKFEKLSGYLPKNSAFASFRNADLTCATFVNVDLTGADFTGADLSGTRFYYSDLSSVKFDNSFVTEKSFNSIKLSSTLGKKACNEIIRENNGYLGPQFVQSNLYGVSFNDAKLYFSHFYDIFAKQINFSGANFSGSEFQLVDLRNSLNLNTAILNKVKYIDL